MEFRVEITGKAYADLRSIYTFVHADSSKAAAEWFNGMELAIASLKHFPLRGKSTHNGYRQIMYGKKLHAYRIVYMVMERSKVVRVLYIRHGAREEIRSSPVQ